MNELYISGIKLTIQDIFLSHVKNKEYKVLILTPKFGTQIAGNLVTILAYC